MPSPEKPSTTPCVTAVMPTSGTPSRRKLAKVAIDSFRRQTYANRRMLILNHGQLPFDLPDENISEVMVEKPATLGELRNIAFDFVTDGYIISWDDDDWMHESRITYQLTMALAKNKEATILRCYTTVAFDTGEAFVRYCTNFTCKGCCGTMLFKVREFRYPALDRREDTELALCYLKEDQLLTLASTPQMYVRTCHDSNTSGREHIMVVQPKMRQALNRVEQRQVRRVLDEFVASGAIPSNPLRRA